MQINEAYKRAEKELENVFITLHGEKFSQSYIEEIITADLVRSIDQDREECHSLLVDIIVRLEKQFPDWNLKARIKSIPSIFYKILDGEDPLDVMGMKVVVPTAEDCYMVRDELAKFFDNKVIYFKDRIIKPKANGYRDLRLVFAVEDKVLEVLVQSNQMYIDSHFKQPHQAAYPWKYTDIVKDLPAWQEQITVID